MNKIVKQIVAIFVGLLLVAGSAVAKNGRPVTPPQGSAPVKEAVDAALKVQQDAVAPVDITANQACYLPEKHAFIVIDSIDCAIDMLVRDNGTLRRVGRFTTDIFQGRHDLKNIIRPISISVLGDNIIVLASAQKDSSYLAVVSMEPVKCVDENGFDTLKAIAVVPFTSCAYGFQIVDQDKEIVVAGHTPVGYDLNVIDYADGIENVCATSNFHYHVPKQAERIQASDPVGVGLTVVAIVVVFFALVCICFIMKGYGAAIMKVQDRKSKKTAPKGEAVVATSSKDVAGEVYAAIAAAIYAYDEDMHDEEDTVITIQKVERAWTPWNAKFYNMNQYFSNRK